MDTEYVYKTIMCLLEHNGMLERGGVHYKSLLRSIEDDLQMSLNELVAEGMLTFKKGNDGQPIFYNNV